MRLLHIVRRYGPAGGMERYVWEITRELARLGHEVQVLCEYCGAEKHEDIKVHELGKMLYRPRWLYYWRFGRRAEKWLKAHSQHGCIIHSHERVGVHDVTTFHGPPFASVRDKPWWKKISLRVAMQLYMERRELRVAKAIVPNSEIIARKLAAYYPEYADKLTKPVVPGVLPGPVRAERVVPKDGGIVGFVGKEWKRKGLPLAVEIVARLRLIRPNLELWVIGPGEGEIRHLFSGWDGGYRLMGWRSGSDHFQRIDVLLHPAIAEPYGMVIAEAMAACVPVVISDACGAAKEVQPDAGTVLPLSASIETWTDAVEHQLKRDTTVPRYEHGWDRVAKEYEHLYGELFRNGML